MKPSSAVTRRRFMQTTLAASLGTRLFGALRQEQFDQAASLLAQPTQATGDAQLAAAVLHVVQGERTFTRAFGQAQTADAMFLLGSISKPISLAALMTLFDQGEFQLDDPLQKFIPAFKGERRDQVTLRHLMTHVSGLPDQLADNDQLRRRHAPLAEFVAHAVRTPLQFAPGARYQYSSMAVLLAAHVAEIITGAGILTLVADKVFAPLQMRHSAQGLGRFTLQDMIRCQTEHAAPESGGGDPAARDWDWNSPYWRQLGAPWGGTHASSPDLAKFLAEFLHTRGVVLQPATARLMTQNHLPSDLPPRGLGFALGPATAGRGASPQTFGHTGSTGTIAWADPATHTLAVILTSLPARALHPHPRDLAANLIAEPA